MDSKTLNKKKVTTLPLQV